VRDSENHAEHNVAYINEGQQGQLMQSMKQDGRKVPTGNTNNAGTAARWTKANGRRHIEGDNPTNKDDGMENYSVNDGYIDVRFMCGNGKGFNVDRELKQFILAS
jgi:hypothetical protein